MIRREDVAARLELNAPLAVRVLTGFIADTEPARHDADRWRQRLRRGATPVMATR